MALNDNFVLGDFRFPELEDPVSGFTLEGIAYPMSGTVPPVVVVISAYDGGRDRGEEETESRRKRRRERERLVKLRRQKELDVLLALEYLRRDW